MRKKYIAPDNKGERENDENRKDKRVMERVRVHEITVNKRKRMKNTQES